MRITFAYSYADTNGGQHKPDETTDLPDAEAQSLLASGWARLADTKKKG